MPRESSDAPEKVRARYMIVIGLQVTARNPRRLVGCVMPLAMLLAERLTAVALGARPATTGGTHQSRSRNPALHTWYASRCRHAYQASRPRLCTRKHS